MIRVRKTLLLKLSGNGEGDLPDFGMGKGVIGYQDAYFTDEEAERMNGLDVVMAMDDIEKSLLDNLVGFRTEITEVDAILEE